MTIQSHTAPLPPREEDDWPRCQGVGGDCGIAYPPGWPELAWHLVHQCCRTEIEECPGDGCLCREPLAVIQHWCEACDGEDPRGCPERKGTPVTAVNSPSPTCGAWGGCPLSSGHNTGQADIPENHHGLREGLFTGPQWETRDPEAEERERATQREA